MLAQLTHIRPFAFRVIGVVGIAAATWVFAPMGLASGDDEPLPGAPSVRSSDRGVANAGTSEVRIAPKQETLGGVAPNSNGGGLVKDGNAVTPGGLPDRVKGGMVCGNIARGFSVYTPVIAC